jgi:hypothetical protein
MMELIESYAKDIYNKYYEDKSKAYENTKISEIILDDINWYLGEYDEDVCYKLKKGDSVLWASIKIKKHVYGIGRDCYYDTASTIICEEIYNNLCKHEEFDQDKGKYLQGSNSEYYSNKRHKAESEIQEIILELYSKIFAMYNEQNNEFPIYNTIKDCKNKKL